MICLSSLHKKRLKIILSMWEKNLIIKHYKNRVVSFFKSYTCVLLHILIKFLLCNSSLGMKKIGLR
jgi:hypothetical protein